MGLPAALLQWRGEQGLGGLLLVGAVAGSMLTHLVHLVARCQELQLLLIAGCSLEAMTGLRLGWLIAQVSAKYGWGTTARKQARA